MADFPRAAVAHYRNVLALQGEAGAAVKSAWRGVNRAHIVDSWDARIPSLTARLVGVQRRAALLGATYGAMTLAQQGTYVAPTALTDIDGFTGWLVDDAEPSYQVPLDGALRSTSYTALSRISAGAGEAEAMSSAMSSLVAVAFTAVVDAARQASSVDLVARPQTGYVRMLNPPSCSRCVVLAGRWYRWNEGFQRHPHCDCVHVPSTVKSTQAAQSEGLITDPYDYFNGLSRREQDQVFTAAGAQAIRDGADVYQVVNARRGMAGANRVNARGGRRNFSPTDPRRRWTREGTTPRSNWSKSGGVGRFRLTPEGVYSQATSQDEALALLKQYGYVLPDGQVPGGSIRGANYQGFGQYGHGGQRRAATDAVLASAQSGVRDGSTYTMTAAERRVHDARRDWDLARSGIDPTSPGAVELRGGARIGGTFRPSTPEQAARYETQYRYWLARNGQVYTP